MSNRYEKIKREGQKRGWIYLRYALPLISVVLCLICMAVPMLQYTNNQSGTDEPISAFTLMKNSWDQVRNYLFGTAEQTNGNLIFSRTVLITLILFWILFSVSAVVAVWSLLAVVRYTEKGSEEDLGRIWFVTLIPNRIVLCILSGLMIPLTAFPRLLTVFYRKIIYVAVGLKVYGIDPMITAILLVVAISVLSAVTAGYEKKLAMDPFQKPAEKTKQESMPIPENRPVKQQEMTEAERRYYEMEKKTRREQAERIAELFRIDKETEDTNKD